MVLDAWFFDFEQHAVQIIAFLDAQQRVDFADVDGHDSLVAGPVDIQLYLLHVAVPQIVRHVDSYKYAIPESDVADDNLAFEKLSFDIVTRDAIEPFIQIFRQHWFQYSLHHHTLLLFVIVIVCLNCEIIMLYYYTIGRIKIRLATFWYCCRWFNLCVTSILLLYCIDNQKGLYVSMKSDLPTFIWGLRIYKLRYSTDPTLGVTSLNPVDLNLLSYPTLSVMSKFDENLVLA